MISRRKWCIAMLLFHAGNIFGPLFGKPALTDEALETGLKAWMNTLFPYDDDSSGAGDLGVHLKLLQKGKQDKNYLNILNAGIQWANNEAGEKSFAGLDEEDAVKIVTDAESRGHSDLPGLFFAYSLYDGTRLYYTNRKTWPALDYPHPPQPLGFPDFANPPDHG